MRHHKRGRKLGRSSSHRRALYRNLAAALILHEGIDTTQAKAKELRGIVERLITQASKAKDTIGKDVDSLSLEEKMRQVHLKRQVARFLPQKYQDGIDGSASVDLIEKLFTNLVPRYKDRPGGYTRVTRIGRRRGDCAPLARIELV